MRKKWNRVISIALVVILSVALAAGCGSSGNSGSNEKEGADKSGASDSGKSHKVVVFTLKATGSLVESVDAFMGSIADGLNFAYEVRFAGDDAATLLSNVESAIAEGYDGIISMTDKGNNAAILELCAENEVYFGGTWSNQASSLNSSEAGYDILKNAYYVGAIADGNDSYNEEIEIYAERVAEEYEALDDLEKEGSIGITTNPAKWTPGQQIAAENMYEALISEYQIPESAFATETIEKRAEDESYAGQTLAAGTWQFPQVDVSSKALPGAYFQSNSNLKLICSFASITYIEPALQMSGLHGKAKVWTCGYEAEDYLVNNFGTQGNQTYQGFRTAPIEAVAFPLVQILDKLNSNSYADKEEQTASLIEAMDSEMGAKFKLKDYMIPYSSSIIVTTDEQFAKFKDGYVYGTANGEDSIVTADDLKALMVTYNEQASYESLMEFFDESGHLKVDALQ